MGCSGSPPGLCGLGPPPCGRIAPTHNPPPPTLHPRAPFSEPSPAPGPQFGQKKRDAKKVGERKEDPRDDGPKGIFGLFLGENPPEQPNVAWVLAAPPCCCRKPTAQGRPSNPAAPPQKKKKRTDRQKETLKIVPIPFSQRPIPVPFCRRQGRLPLAAF